MHNFELNESGMLRYDDNNKQFKRFMRWDSKIISKVDLKLRISYEQMNEGREPEIVIKENTIKSLLFRQFPFFFCIFIRNI